MNRNNILEKIEDEIKTQKTYENIKKIENKDQINIKNNNINMKKRENNFHTRSLSTIVQENLNT